MPTVKVVCSIPKCRKVIWMDTGKDESIYEKTGIVVCIECGEKARTEAQTQPPPMIADGPLFTPMTGGFNAG